MSLPASILERLRCPRCGGELEELACGACEARFDVLEGIADLYEPHEDGGLTEAVRAFYEGTPFPGYDPGEDPASLRAKVRANPFARMLDEQIPFGATVLEVGCGTGQLSNLLALAHRCVVGVDLCGASLRLAEGFRARHGLERAGFARMNLFRPGFEPASFDLVICSGVLHHTGNPREGFLQIANLVRPGGYLLVGLYHRYGRLGTHLRRGLFRLGGPALHFLDPRAMALEPERRATWLRDQYANPHESSHGIGEVAWWVREAGLTWVRSIPGPRPFEPLEPGTSLFRSEPPARDAERWLAEVVQGFLGAREGGLFVVIAHRPELR